MKKLLFIFFLQYIFPAIIYIPQDYTTIQEGINNASRNVIEKKYASGIYFVNLLTDMGRCKTKKVMLMR